MLTLIQRFGSALNLNIHFHVLFLDGVYAEYPDGSLRFRWVTAPTSAELTHLIQVLAHRIGRLDARRSWRAPFGRTACVQIRSWRICLERQGLLERDAENCSLCLEKMARPEGQTSNSLFETLTGWSNYLEAHSPVLPGSRALIGKRRKGRASHIQATALKSNSARITS